MIMGHMCAMPVLAAGAKVRCVEPDGAERIKRGHVYTVAEFRQGTRARFVVLEEVPGPQFRTNRFVRVDA